MAIVIIRQDGKMEEWKQALLEADPSINIYTYDEPHPKEDILMALVWKHPEGSLAGYPRMQCVASFGAGVDFIWKDPDLPDGIPVTRVVDPVLASDMSEYVLTYLLGYMKNSFQYQNDQRKRIWKPVPYKRIKDVQVGIMGLGALGSDLAHLLSSLGFPLVGWSRRPKEDLPLRSFSGEQELHAFMAACQVVVCLLPLTTQTEGILNRHNLRHLPKGAYLINAARGGHLVEEDLIPLIEERHLSGACLDVFREEPLPEDHPFWCCDKIQISPHIASVSDINSVTPQIIDNYLRLVENQPLMNLVSREQEY